MEPAGTGRECLPRRCNPLNACVYYEPGRCHRAVRQAAVDGDVRAAQEPVVMVSGQQSRVSLLDERRLFMKGACRGTVHILLTLAGLAGTASASESWRAEYPPNAANAIAYDEARHQAVEVTLSGPDGGPMTFVWNSVRWTQRFPQNAPPSGTLAMAYDALHEQVVLYSNTNPTYAGVSSVWIWDGVNWTLTTPSTSPPSLAAEMAYDRAHGQVVLFGATGDFSGFPTSSATWVWDGRNWTQKFPRNSPPARYNAALVYDEARRQTVLFGGHPDSSDTWIWDGSNWTQKFPQSSPPASGTVTGTYDVAHREVMVLTFSNTGLETWVWDGANWTRKSPQTSPPSLD